MTLVPRYNMSGTTAEVAAAGTPVTGVNRARRNIRSSDHYPAKATNASSGGAVWPLPIFFSPEGLLSILYFEEISIEISSNFFSPNRVRADST